MRRLVAALLVLALGGASGMANERPVHHDPAGGFRNLEPWDRAGPLVTIPFFLRRIGATIVGRGGAPSPIPNDGAALRENARHSSPTVTWIGHATVLVQMDHVTFLTDPIWSDTASPVSFLGPRRFVPPAVAIDDLPPLHFVVVSHNHYDHLDLPTLRRLAARGTRFFVPLGVGTLLRDEGIGPVEELDWWESREVGGVTVHCVPARHWSQRGLADFSQTLWSGWAVVGPTRRFWFAGDTGSTASFRDIGARLGPFQLAAVPIGAYAPAEMMQPVHMNPEEALQAGLDAGAQRMLGVHWGTFDLTDEPVDEPPRRFHAAAIAQGVEPARIWTPAPGETRLW